MQTKVALNRLQVTSAIMHCTRPAGVRRLRVEEVVHLVRSSFGDFGEMQASCAHVPCPHLPTYRKNTTSTGAPAVGAFVKGGLLKGLPENDVTREAQTLLREACPCVQA